MVCARAKTAVSGLEQEFAGKVRTANVDATTADVKPTIESLGFRSHGIVLRSADGKELWKQADHSVSIDDARKEILLRI